MENLGGEIVKTLVALAFIGVLAFVSLSLIKRIQEGRFKPGAGHRPIPGEMRFVRAMPLGTKERVVVVHYDGDELLLGVTTGGITLLARKPIAVDPPAADTPPA